MTNIDRSRRTSVFERINEFMGAHVECVRAREQRVRYDLSFVSDSDACVITLRCGCGSTSSLLAGETIGREIAAMTLAHDTPMSVRTTPRADARELLEV